MVAAVIVSQKEATGRKKRDLEIASAGLPIYSLDELDTVLQTTKAEAGVLAAFGKIVPEKVIQAFPKGIINVHPSLLPRYRGSTPIETAILNGDNKTGVSLMALDKGMDTGNIYVQQEISISSETKQELADKLDSLAARMLEENIEDILNGKLKPSPQKGEPSYTQRLGKQMSEIDWDKSAIDIERQIRAYLGWPGSKTELAGVETSITKVSVIEKQGKPGTTFVHNKKPAIYCGQDALVLEELKPSGKSSMSGQSFLNGYSL